MDVLASYSIFQELQLVHDTGYFSALPSLEETWQQVNDLNYLCKSCGGGGGGGDAGAAFGVGFELKKIFLFFLSYVFIIFGCVLFKMFCETIICAYLSTHP